MTTPSDASQAVELPPLPGFLATNLCAAMQEWCDAEEGDAAGEAFEHVVRRFNSELRTYARAAIAQDRAARAQAEPVAWMTPDGMSVMTPDEKANMRTGDPEDDGYAERHDVALVRATAARAQGAGEAVADSPVAKVVMKNGEIQMAATYMPGLPDGEHDLYAAAIPQAAEVPGFVLATSKDPGRDRQIGICDEGHEPFWHWVRKAYRDADSLDTCFSLWNMQVAFKAGWMQAIAAAPTPTASAPKAEGEAEPETFVSRWTRVIRDMPSAYEHPATQTPSEADRTLEGGDVIYQNAGWVDFNEYQSFKACRSDRITLWTDNKGGMMPLYQQFGTTTSEGAKP